MLEVRGKALLVGRERMPLGLSRLRHDEGIKLHDRALRRRARGGELDIVHDRLATLDLDRRPPRLESGEKELQDDGARWQVGEAVGTKRIGEGHSVGASHGDARIHEEASSLAVTNTARDRAGSGCRPRRRFIRNWSGGGQRTSGEEKCDDGGE